MILKARIRAAKLERVFVERNRFIEKMEPHTVRAITLALLCVEVVVCAAIVLVNVIAFNQDGLHSVREIAGQVLCHDTWAVLRRDK
jgi:hypothetical protein